MNCPRCDAPFLLLRRSISGDEGKCPMHDWQAIRKPLGRRGFLHLCFGASAMAGLFGALDATRVDQVVAWTRDQSILEIRGPDRHHRYLIKSFSQPGWSEVPSVNAAEFALYFGLTLPTLPGYSPS